jgi:hypothetical protein
VKVDPHGRQAYFCRPRGSRPLRLVAGCWQLGQGGMSPLRYQHSANSRTQVIDYTPEELDGLNVLYQALLAHQTVTLNTDPTDALLR